MPGIGGLDGISAGAHLYDQIGDVFERRVRQMRNMPASEAHVIADAVLGNAAERGVQFVRGSDFVLEGHESSLRLAYSGVTPAEIEEGVSRLADAYRAVASATAGVT